MRTLAIVLLLALSAAACVAGGVDEGSRGLSGSDLVPTFAPATTSASPAGPDPTDPGPTSEPADPTQSETAVTGNGPEASPTEPTSPPRATTETAPERPSPAGEAPSRPVARAEVDDAAGDVTFSAEPPPDHADLLGAEVVRDADGFTVRHELKGGAPPDTDDEHTMNIATFFDVDGDGEVDHHVWANLSSSGWGSAYFDERSGTARYADEDDVDVHVDDEGRVVVRFPHGHLSDARSFRWSVASEWGRYEVIGTDAAARDSAPEDHGSVAFPQ